MVFLKTMMGDYLIFRHTHYICNIMTAILSNVIPVVRVEIIYVEGSQ